MYAEPKRLEQLGYRRSRKEPGKTRERADYTLTQNGHAALDEWLTRPSPFPKIQSEAAIRIQASDLASRPTGKVSASIAAMRVEIDGRPRLLQESERRAPELPSPTTPALRLLRSLGRRLLQAHFDLGSRRWDEISAHADRPRPSREPDGGQRSATCRLKSNPQRDARGFVGYLGPYQVLTAAAALRGYASMDRPQSYASRPTSTSSCSGFDSHTRRGSRSSMNDSTKTGRSSGSTRLRFRTTSTCSSIRSSRRGDPRARAGARSATIGEGPGPQTRAWWRRPRAGKGARVLTQVEARDAGSGPRRRSPCHSLFPSRCCSSPEGSWSLRPCCPFRCPTSSDLLPQEEENPRISGGFLVGPPGFEPGTDGIMSSPAASASSAGWLLSAVWRGFRPRRPRRVRPVSARLGSQLVAGWSHSRRSARRRTPAPARPRRAGGRTVEREARLVMAEPRCTCTAFQPRRNRSVAQVWRNVWKPTQESARSSRPSLTRHQLAEAGLDGGGLQHPAHQVRLVDAAAALRP